MDSELTHNHNNNNIHSKSLSNKTSDHSIKHSINTTISLDEGLGGMSSLLDRRLSEGILMKCNLKSISNNQKPNSLAIKTQDNNNEKPIERTNIGEISVMKTLRKGGFV